MRQEDGRAAMTDAEAERIAAILGGQRAFRDLPASLLLAIVRGGEPFVFSGGDLIIRKGDRSEYAYLVLDGSVHVSIETSYSPVQLASLTAPCLVGDIGVFTGAPRTADVRAGASGHGLRFDAALLHRAGEEHPRFLAAAMRELGGRIETFNRAIGFYTNALSALQRYDFDLALLDDLRNPLPELADFSHSFRQLAEEIMHRRAQRQEMASAAAIQRAMLPFLLSDAQTGGRVSITADMRPAKDVGGDTYDFLLSDSDTLVVSIGDVSGKGIPASLFMTATQTAMRMVFRQEGTLEEKMRRANELLSADNREMMFVTFFCAVIDLRTGAFDYCNAGHNPPLVLRADGRLEKPTVANLALGIMEEARFRCGSMKLTPGDRLLLFTDGLPEAVDPRNIPFGDDQLEEAALRLHRAGGDADLVTVLHDRVQAYAAGAPQFDDLTSVSVLYRGAA